MELTIRKAGGADAALIAEFSRQTFYETFAAYNSAGNMEKFMSGQFSRELLMKEVTAPGNIFLLAYYGKELVGYARLRENNNPPELAGLRTLEIARIYAAGEHIGKGVGKALLLECFHIARQKNITTIWLGVWEHNQRAIGFYNQWGFEKFSTHIFMLGDDPQTDWLMKKELEPVK